MKAMHRNALAALGMIALLGGAAASGRAEEAKTEAAPAKPEKHPVLMYIPNRLFDILDLARARVRVGPGFTVQARVNLPAGFETFAGAEVSVVGDTTEQGWSKPYYGTLEVGAGFQAAIVGIDVGIDPLETFDFIAGIFFFDPKGDDY